MIAQYSIPTFFYNKDFETQIDNYALGGTGRSLTKPCMWYYNGATYNVAYKNNSYNNQVIITKTVGTQITDNTVGEGTDGSEPLNHPTPLIYVDESTGYIYVIQNEFHVDRFRVWKSDYPENIDFFTLVGHFGTNESYLGLLDYSGTNCTFVTRGSGTSSYGQSIIKVDLNDASNYEEIPISDANFSIDDVRHYPSLTWKYGTSDYTAWAISKRYEPTGLVYTWDLLLTPNGDYENIYNVGLGYTKNVSVDGVLTNTELDTNFEILGDSEDTSVTLGSVDWLQLNDFAYIFYLSDVESNRYSCKRVNLLTGDEISLLMPENYKNFYCYYNGTNITLTAKFDDGEDVYTSKFHLELDLSSYTCLREIDTPDGMYVGMPLNLDYIPRNKRFTIIGRSVTSVGGIVPYTVTNEK